MTPEQKQWLETHFVLWPPRNLLEYPAFVGWFDEQLNLEAEACAEIVAAHYQQGGLDYHDFHNCGEIIAAEMKQRIHDRT